MKKLLFLLLIIFIISCSAFQENADLSKLNDKANESLIGMKGYQPIDPIQLKITKEKDSLSFKDIIDEFPNEATRIAIGKLNQNGSLTFGPFSVAKKGESYSVIIDYIKYISTSLPTKYSENYSIISYKEYRAQSSSFIESLLNDEQISKIKKEDEGQKIIQRDYSLKTNHGEINGERFKKQPEFKSKIDKNLYNKIKAPVYVGVGLRIQASVTALKDSINLGSLYGLGLAASQNELNGTLIIQSLGISGENISPIIPIPSRISESTIQTAMQSIATIKSKIYNKKTKITPQVVGFGLPYLVDGAKDLIETTLHTAPPHLFINNNGRIRFEQVEYTENEKNDNSEVSDFFQNTN